ncbi:hypothetical protein BCIN_11g04140 [Botrytis cinerea B05.10]|uniref:Zn(2)-C6 fungal-type domain-containing protein n=2 Tax=Botryotinia fuckeliana TaxID=40559 RepID=A0A384JWZ5_BOTFB|nr:hypothetical protein BCIN_11g04140 [Botrytis cinerea B05.10]ATZ55126.1 hypothetical protein BCIN_11g04140 [Botrytis cinerea B05.10]
MDSTGKQKDATAKHRACDECRTRKLACSKDPNGCERCVRENISCHYSQQKQMGRPRKRQFIEAIRDEPPNTPNSLQPLLDDGTLLPFFGDEHYNFDDNHFAEPYYTNSNFNEFDPAQQFQQALPLDTPHPIWASNAGDGRNIWQFGNRDMPDPAPIDFSNMNVENLSETQPEANQEAELSTGSNPSSSSPSGSGGPFPISGDKCSCLSSMYLSLSALHQFPSEIDEALKVVRGASIVASKAIWCPACGAIALISPTPPIEAFQNTMLIGTILPIIANGYGRLLKMVDEATSEAIAKGQTKIFRYLEYGGLCEHQRPIHEAVECIGNALPMADREMQPAEWRTTVRALLRADIYGHDQPGFKYKGLRDIISEMEQRQNARHNILDAQVAAGVRSREHDHFPDLNVTDSTARQCYGEKTRGCLEILKIAKMAVDSIVIA